MMIFIKCLIAAVIAYGGAFAACAAGVYVGTKENEINNRED
jgi:hypothetical protein